jgi:tRNA uridine 5-carboxymethylaminomethyl modification enzyme
MKTRSFDIVVIGAGHAGCEAALAAARMGCDVLVLAINTDRIAHMPCNPAIGGIGKGQLVREIDALGGEMGRNIDATLVQIKVLNTGKGPAVRALRAQADKWLYSELMKQKLLSQERLCLRQDEAVVVARLASEALMVETVNGNRYIAKNVILTTGTFLKGQMIIGDIVASGGRAGEGASDRLSDSLLALGLELGRFQSATPPRVLARAIDYSKMTVQPGDQEEPLSFSFHGTPRIRRGQLDCWLTYTNKATHRMVEKHLHLSPIRGGVKDIHGPRYCPSIDRKVASFPERERHPVFVEPEGRHTRELYLQGLTTSMPVAIQEKIIRTVPGLEAARIVRPGYAVAYDYLPPYQLKSTLECQDVPGLFTAGQINGTSGYEEAAAQGLIAGVNAARRCLNRKPVTIGRSQAFIGVLIDDLVTKKIDEPYRMFTSRAEHRLILRSDNADLRLSLIGHDLGLISQQALERVEQKRRDIAACVAKLGQITLKGPQLKEIGLPEGEALKAKALLKRPEITLRQLAGVAVLPRTSKSVRDQVEIEIKYEGYIKRQLGQVMAQEKLEHLALPRMDYGSLTALSAEAREKLTKVKPESIRQAAEISGVSPADISILLVYLADGRWTS